MQPGAPELGGWAASPKPLLAVSLLQILLKSVQCTQVPSSFLAGGQPDSQRSKEESFSPPCIKFKLLGVDIGNIAYFFIDLASMC